MEEELTNPMYCACCDKEMDGDDGEWLNRKEEDEDNMGQQWVCRDCLDNGKAEEDFDY